MITLGLVSLTVEGRRHGAKREQAMQGLICSHRARTYLLDPGKSVKLGKFESDRIRLVCHNRSTEGDEL